MRLACGSIAILAGVWLAGGAAAGETRCWFENGAVVVPASFGEIAGDFILDLSAPHSVLHETSARTHGIEGDASSATLRLAGETIPDLTIKVVNLDSRESGFVTNIVGIVGADVAIRYHLVLHYAPCRLRLENRHRRARGATSAPVRMIGGVPTIRAIVTDGRLAQEGDFAIATGSSPVAIAGARLARAPKAATTPARIRAVEVAGTLFEQVPATVTGEAPAGTDGAIGNAVWSHFDLELDASRGTLELRPRD